MESTSQLQRPNNDGAAAAAASTPERLPTLIRYGGFVIDFATMMDWGSRLDNCRYDPNDRWQRDSARLAVTKEVGKHQPARFIAFGKGIDWRNHGLMIATQGKPYGGDYTEDASQIPQFHPGETEKMAEKMLKEHGITKYQFKTVIYT